MEMATNDIDKGGGGGGFSNRRRILVRWCCSLAVLVFLLFFAVFIFAVLFFIPKFPSISTPISVASECKIVSTSVDLKSSKVCELGFLNYKAKNVLYPFKRTNFRCRYDYYWASVFKVEYQEHSSGQRRRAFAEAPKEALPIDCRPGFGIAWLMKEKFRVNETYNCRYILGLSEVDIYSDSQFNCHAKDPSTAEMIRRYSILFTRILSSSFSSKGSAKQAVLDSAAGIFSGVSSALIFVTLVKLLVQLPKIRLSSNGEDRKVHFRVFGACIKRTCFLVVYLSVMGYITIQYVNIVGLTKIFTSS